MSQLPSKEVCNFVPQERVKVLTMIYHLHSLRQARLALRVRILLRESESWCYPCRSRYHTKALTWRKSYSQSK